MTKVAVVLSGCGHQDGAEVREAVLSLLYLDEQGAEVSIFAPDIAQRKVANHLNGQTLPESRNVLVEAARIARGNIAPLAALKPEAFDALVVPGGYGVALNLSDLAIAGEAGTVNADFQNVITAFLKAGKPIGAICIAPAVLALAAKGAGLTLTIGDDAGVASMITALGHTHIDCATASYVLDTAHKVASCPAYMDGNAKISEVAQGIRQVVEQVLRMAQHKQKAA